MALNYSEVWRAVAQVASAASPDTHSPAMSTDVCTICLEGSEEPTPIQRGCACRGAAGCAHTACMVDVASHGGEGYHRAWYKCQTCAQQFTGPMQMALANELVARLGDLDPDDEEHLCAQTLLANALADMGNDSEAAALQRQILATQERVYGADSPGAPSFPAARL